MVSKANKKVLREKQANKVTRYGLRKLKTGISLVAIGASLTFGAQQVEAAADQPIEEAVQAQEERQEPDQALNEEAPSENQVQEPQENSESGNQAPVQEESQATSQNQLEPAPTNEESQDPKPDLKAAEPIENSAREEAGSNAVSPEAPVEEAAPLQDPIPENSLRIHLNNLPEGVSEEGASLWVWGDVAQSSDQLGAWPEGAIDFKQKPGQEAYYIDLAQNAGGGDVNYLLLDKTRPADEVKVTEEDQTIQLLSPDMQEVWLDKDLRQYSYEPIENEDIIRINYFREDGDYEKLGVWSWFDTESQGGNWPTDAYDFEGIGQYGAYLDLPLTNGLDSNVGFLIVNKETAEQTNDFVFGDRENHSQIFIRQADQTVYTNPYYYQEKDPVLDAKPGDKAISFTVEIANQNLVGPALDYRENAVLKLQIEKPEGEEIKRIIADTSSIGGHDRVEIPPQLSAITINVDHSTPAGQHDIPIRIYDSDYGYYEKVFQVTVEPADESQEQVSWDQQIIYFLLTDRFYNGDPSNDNPYQMPYDQAENQRGTYQGGDFKGIIDKLDYFEDLGVTAIWISPIVENIAFDVQHDSEHGEDYAYHGYWASDFEKLNPHFGSLEEFHQLIDEAADRNIAIMVDVVLNHAGYGMNADEDLAIPGFPSAEKRESMAGMFRTEPGKDVDKQTELSGLPDFLTEEAEVSQQLVDWQTAWLKKATTPSGNSIHSFRVDTVKHVDDITWIHFKNELAMIDPHFRLIGEYWGGSHKNDGGYLDRGMMDSLLDFGFKDIAKQLVQGDLEGANAALIERNDFIESSAGLGQFLGSHDEDGFLYSIGGNTDHLKLAASLQIMAKGQPVIYYGEELGQSGANNWPVQDNRYDFAWDQVEGNEILDHYKKLIQFRKDHSQVLARGSNESFAGSNWQEWLVAKRSLGDEAVYIGYNLASEDQSLRLQLSNPGTVVYDAYQDKYYQAEEEAGAYYATISLPAIEEGGTALLVVEDGDILKMTELGASEDLPEIEEGYFRLHFESLPESDSPLGLWIWEDVAVPSEEVAGWPSGATSFKEGSASHYGWYLDIPINQDNFNQIGFLIVDAAGNNYTGDKAVNIIHPDMQEAWIDSDFQIYPYQPLEKEGLIRVNYYDPEGKYDDLGLWVWGDVQTASDELGDWPNGAMNLSAGGKYGAFVDIKLAASPNEVGAIIVNKKTGDQSSDLAIDKLENHTQFFIRKGDSQIYTNPYYVSESRPKAAVLSKPTEIQIFFDNLEAVSAEDLEEAILVTNDQGQVVNISDLKVDSEAGVVTLTGEFLGAEDLLVQFEEQAMPVRSSWQLTDYLYAYEGDDLGPSLYEDGSASFKLWAPSADKVSLVLYDKSDPDKVLGEFALAQSQDPGVWAQTLQPQEAGLETYEGYYYHYKIVRDGQAVLTLDPYAKSMAEWNVSEGEKIGKAAIVDPSKVGSKLDFAQIPQYQGRQDAIIYEVHVRDFTSDPDIQTEDRFGSFKAFIEKLDYLEDLGVTHIQLLPVLNYYYADEGQAGERSLAYSSQNENYNWGYDPQHYFALTGMYSENPSDPYARIEEFKELVDEIHQRGMGVILDVVYNHTAKTFIFEDLEPHYYHFMNADGSPRESFGGGRLGTTHAMARKLLVDSIAYLVDEYKVDGFRFDMMGDHDAETIQAAYNRAAELNPNILFLGEGWLTYVGDELGPKPQPADQTWMDQTDDVGVFSDEIRNELKSGFGSEGEARFLTGGPRKLEVIFNNIIANPSNITNDQPQDVVQYIAAHDNLTLHDVIAQSIKKDPKDHQAEIQARIRLGNLIILTSQGTPFIHSGQEYGRTKQFKDPDYIGKVENPPYKSTFMVDEAGQPFEYPYFIHDSYDSSDRINHFDWDKVQDPENNPHHYQTYEYTKGLIGLRRQTDAFRQANRQAVQENVRLILTPEMEEIDLIIAYEAKATNGDRYAVFINADSKARSFSLMDGDRAYLQGDVIVDGQRAGVQAIDQPFGVEFRESSLVLQPLTAIIIRLSGDSVIPEEEDLVGNEKLDEVKEAEKLDSLEASSNSQEIDQAPSKVEDSPDQPAQELVEVKEKGKATSKKKAAVVKTSQPEKKVQVQQARPVKTLLEDPASDIQEAGRASDSTRLPKTGQSWLGLALALSSLITGTSLARKKKR